MAGPYGFNTAVAEFGETDLGPVRVSVDYGEGEVDWTSSADTAHKKLSALPDPTVTVEHFGCALVAHGAQDSLTITWPDANDDSLTNVVCVGETTRGRVNEAITATLTFRCART